MMNSIVIGQYVPGNGFFYRLDPRTKIMAVFFLMIAVFLLENIMQLGIALLLAVILMLIGKLSLGRIIKGLKPIFVLLIFTFVFQIALNTEGPLLLDRVMHFNLISIGVAILWFVLWRVAAKHLNLRILLFLVFVMGLYYIFRHLSLTADFFSFNLRIYEKGIEMSVFVVIRLLIIITFTTVLTLTTKPTDLTQALESLLRPLKKIGFNSEDFALIISISLRYIPTIFDEAQKIMAAQASRGADFSQGKIKDKLKQIISLLVPMFIIAFMRSEELADAMESRNFVPGQRRTRINILRFSIIDIYTGIFTLACITVAIVIRVM